MEIRVGEDEHLPEIVELLGTRGWGDEFDPDLGDVYIAVDEAVIGCLQLVEIDDQAAVLDLVLVDEARRREGVGTALVTAAAVGAPVTLYVSCRRDAVPFYESLGFSLLTHGTDSAPKEVRGYWREVGNRAPLALVRHSAEV